MRINRYKTIVSNYPQIGLRGTLVSDYWKFIIQLSGFLIICLFVWLAYIYQPQISLYESDYPQRSAQSMAVCMAPQAAISSVQSGNWSSSSTWSSGQVPASADDITIASSHTVTVDANVNVKSITVNGTLKPDYTKNLAISAEWIMVKGVFEWGTATNPYLKQATITLQGPKTTTSIMGMGSKFLGAMEGGQIFIHGTSKKSWTQLSVTARPNATTITVKEPIDWVVGDDIVVASTEAYIFDNDEILKENEQRKITAISADKKTITLDMPLSYHHYGELQNYTNGVQSWVLDERAEVGLLSRNIKIQGDASSSTSKFGAHVMIMETAKAFISDIEFVRVGQEFANGRYPFHWHLAKNVSGQYIQNTSIHESYNRAITIHGSQNGLVKNNTVFDVVGHAVFLEDAAEWGNVIDGNLVMTVRRPASNKALIGSDIGQHGDRLRGPSAYWITNPNNTFTNNVAVGIHGVGFWYGLTPAATGLSVGTVMQSPLTTPIKKFDNNRVHGAFVGFHIDHKNDNTATGAIIGVDNSQYNPAEWQTVTNLTVYKCFRGWWTRTGNRGIIFDRTILADCIGRGMTVSSFEGKTTNSLFVGYSANNPKGINFENKAISLYDGYTNAYDCHFENFDQDKQAVFEWFGGAVNKTNNVFTRCTFKKVKMFNPDYLIPESNKLMSVAHDADGQITGTPFGGLCIGHNFLIDDQNFTPITGRYAYKSTRHFATLRIDHDRTNNTKNAGLTYVEWSDGHGIHVDEYDQFKLQLAVVPNIGRKYKVRFMNGIPPIVDFDLLFGRPNDVLDIQIVDATSELKVANGADPKTTESAVFSSTSSAWAWVNGTLHLRMVATGGSTGVDGMNASEAVRVQTVSGQTVAHKTIASRPYAGKAQKENTKVEAEWFDYGGLKVAYNRAVGGTREYMKDNPEELTDFRSGEVLRLPLVNGKRVIGDISSGNWMNYTYQIQQSGTYMCKVNLASNTSGSIKIKVDGTQVLTTNFAATGGVNTFKTVDMGNIPLSTGKHVITVEAGSAGFLLDWISVGTPSSISEEAILNFSAPEAPSAVCNPELYTFHFDLTGTAEQKVNKLKNLGLKGIVFQVSNNQLSLIDAYKNTTAVKNGSFAIYTIYQFIDLNQPVDYTAIQSIYRKIAGTNTLFQIIFRQQATDAYLKEVIGKIADIAQTYAKELVIYPHDHTRIQSADEALAVINQVNKPNIFLALHLCHELRAGNGATIAQVVARVAPYIKVVTMSGATLSESGTTGIGWADVIKPMNAGTYDVAPFYAALHQANYTGPIGIHSFGIKASFNQSADVHIPNSIGVINGLANETCGLTASNTSTTDFSITGSFVARQGLVEDNSQLFVKIQPNPFHNRFSFQTSDTPIKAELYDSKGSHWVVSLQKLASDLYQVDACQMASGLYYLRIQTSTTSYIVKVVKE